MCALLKIGYSLTDCARADQLIEQFQQTDSYKNITAANQQFFAQLTNFTGFPIPVTLENLYVIQDALFIESVHNLPWPAWCTADVYEK
uniref:Uncharacterized protein n=1 Tax=Plectus sambesii TaxID=2011161 RepID=A0A914VLB3_9BILA